MPTINPPSWFSNDKIVVSTAPTCGIAKGGRVLPQIDEHGQRVQVLDPETGEKITAVDDIYLSDAQALLARDRTDTLRDIPRRQVTLRTAVPVYYDRRFHEHFVKAMRTKRFAQFKATSFGKLIEDELLTLQYGHGSPGREERVGEIPYIKVSDLRAGLVNINPTNRVPQFVAKKLWRGTSSHLQAFDILSPERTSKNIGDFCVLMPGQEQVVLTREIIVLRPGPKASFDSFFLLWALTLKIVRDQWKRVVFMQTNREDVGDRWLEIEIPLPKSDKTAEDVARPFRDYYTAVATARSALSTYLHKSDQHHFFVSGAEPPEPDPQAAAAEDDIVGLD
jgi:type I restriction enzyme M protein